MKKLLILATSGTGKTTLRKYLESVAELKKIKITEVDDYLNFPPEAKEKLRTLQGTERAEYWVAEELAASKRAIDDKSQVCFTVGLDERIRNVFINNGFEIIILELSEEELLRRIHGRNKEIQIELAVYGLSQLKKLPYLKISAEGPIEDIAQNIISYLGK